MGLTKPDNEASVDLWGVELNNSLDTADAHDHTTGKGVKVPTAGLNINADLPMAGFGMTNVKVVDLAAVLSSSVTAYATALFVNSSDNELYWRTSGGSNVQLTSGTSLNASLLGGFTGDYGTGGSAANYNSGTSIFNFIRAANHRAFLDTSDIRLFQGTSGITNAVKIRSPNALAASYDWIFPTALPAAQRLLSMSTGGQVEHGAAAAMPALLTLEAGATASVNQSFTVSGTGKYKRGPRVRPINPSGGAAGNGTAVPINTTGAQVQLNEVFLVNLDMHEGERLTQVQARVLPDGAGDIIRMRVYRVDASGSGIPSRTQLGADQSSVSGTTSQTLTQSGLTETVGTSLFTYHVEFVTTAVVVNAVNVTGIWITTDVP